MMEELELAYEPAYEGSKEHLEHELTQRFSTEGRGPIDELHLAAYLGKTLLDKNRELEQKLKRLQKFAEDTLATNQILSRHLAETKDHLQTSNLTCEHLEARLEEKARANDSLRKARDTRQASLEQKTRTIQDLEERVELLEKELAEQKARLEQRDHKCKSCSLSKSRRRGEEEEEGRGPSEGTDGAEALKECETTHQREVETLKLKLQQTELQHRVAARNLQEVLAENQNLSLSLEKAETESQELQTRLKYLEDTYEKQSPDVPLMSPKCPSLTSTPKHAHVTRFPFGSPGSPHSKTPHWGVSNGGSTSAAVVGGGGGEKGMSLFNELDSHCSHLQSQYEDLLERCTCPASVQHRGDHIQLTPPLSNATTTAALVAVGHGEEGKPSLERPLMELFDEMFSTLRETAQVADRLVERR